MTELAARYNVPEIELPDGDRLHLLYVPLSWASQKFLDGNVKRHDIGTLHQSIERYSFRDPMSYDAAANNGNGGIVAGNGRLETLCGMFNEGYDPPGLILPTEDGRDWLIPMLFGADSATAAEAQAYAIDHNIAPLKGGNFTSHEILSGLFDPSVFDQLEMLYQSGTPTTAISGDELDDAMEALENIQKRTLAVPDFGEADETEQGSQLPPPVTNGTAIAIVMDQEMAEDWLSFKTQVNLKDDKAAFARLLAIANDALG